MLNSSLHKALERNFGEVRIVAEGCPMVRRYEGDSRCGRRLVAECPGEYYRVNCPFCNDHKGRLWINHRWGVLDPQTGTCNLWLAICYHENCLSDPFNLGELKQQTTWYGRLSRAGRVMIAEGPAPAKNQVPELPVDFVPLDELSNDHPALQYLAARGFDPDELVQRWGVGFSKMACPWSRHGRLVIPIHQPAPSGNGYRGWQARAIDDEDEPKYYTAYGLKKSEVLYGLAQVAAKGPVIICEGVTDVWRLGENAVALLGKTASHEQMKLIRNHFVGRPLVVMLDADAEEDARKLRARLESARKQSLLKPDSAPVVLAELPPGRDPGSCSHEQLEEIVALSLA